MSLRLDEVKPGDVVEGEGQTYTYVCITNSISKLGVQVVILQRQGTSDKFWITEERFAELYTRQEMP